MQGGMEYFGDNAFDSCMMPTGEEKEQDKINVKNELLEGPQENQDETFLNKIQSEVDMKLSEIKVKKDIESKKVFQN